MEKLLDQFELRTYEQWKAAAESDLKGAPFEKKLYTQTADGLTFAPLYTQADIAELLFVDSLPGAYPYLRAGKAAGLKPRARIRAFANIGSEPAIMLTGPIDVIGVDGPGALKEDLREACLDALKLDRSEVRRFAERYSWAAATRQFLSHLHPFTPAAQAELTLVMQGAGGE